jgi:hypothetical protein
MSASVCLAADNAHQQDWSTYQKLTKIGSKAQSAIMRQPFRTSMSLHLGMQQRRRQMITSDREGGQRNNRDIGDRPYGAIFGFADFLPLYTRTP